MLLLWAALFILLLGKRVKGEQLLSSAQVDVYTTSSSEDAITCLGSVPTNFNEDFYYEDTFNFDTFQGERRHHDLAAFCVKAVRARCHTSGSEQYIAFDTLLSYEAEHIARWRKWPIETTASRPDGPHVGLLEDPTYRQIQLISEICQIKCRCSHPLPGLDLTFYQKPQAPGGEQRGFYNWDDRFFEWNFDSHISRWRDSHDIEDGEEEHNLRQAWWKGGFVDPNYRGGRFSDGNWETGSLTAGRQTYQYYRGSEANRPTCVKNHIPPSLSGRMSLIAGTQAFTSWSELCLHRYYGGNNFTSMGGVCSTTGAGKRTFSLHEIYRSPMFGDSTRSSVLVGGIRTSELFEAYCRAHCWCDSPQEAFFDTRRWSAAFDNMRSAQSWSSGSSWSAPTGQCRDGSDSSCASGQDRDSMDTSAPSGNHATRQCNAQCTTPKGGGKPTCSNSSCMCRALRSIDIFPGNTGKYVGWCISAVSAAVIQGVTGSARRGGKTRGRRHLALVGQNHPCPCNATYVSHGCCESEDGIVWEPIESKLGELKL